jgi:hypothetical protein
VGAAGTAGSAAVAAGTTVATEAGGVGLVAGTGASAGLTAGQLAGYAATAATGVSALATLARGAPGINLPPAPHTNLGTDQSVAQAEQQALQRAQVRGGLSSTTGTEGGQAGSVLNPATLSSKTLLGG